MEPAGSAVSAYGALLDELRGVRWPPRQRVHGGAAGVHGSTRRGLGAEFSEYRAYRQGDDPRQLDWKLLGRTDRAYVRLAEEQAILPTVLVLDGSASLAYPVAGWGKWRLACQIAMGLAAVAYGSGDPVGIVIAAADGVVSVVPRTRRGIVGEIAVALAGVAPGGAQPVGPAVVAARSLVRRGGRLVVISDFLSDDGGGLVADSGECIAVHVAAREELDPPWQRAAVVDPEQPGMARALVGASRDAYVERFAAWRGQVARSIRAAGAVYTLVVTDERPAAAVRRIVAQ